MLFNKNTKSFFIILAIFIVLYILLKVNKTDSDWELNYRIDYQEPYDISAFNNSFKHQKKFSLENINTFVQSTELDKTKQTYIFLDQQFELNNTGKANIQNLLRNGNDVFLIIHNSTAFEFNQNTDYEIHMDEFNEDANLETETTFIDSTEHLDENKSVLNSKEEISIENNFIFYAQLSKTLKLDFANYKSISTNFIGPDNARVLNWQSIEENMPIGEQISKTHATINNKPIWISSTFLNNKLHFISTPFIFSNFFLKSDTNLQTLDYFFKQIRHKNIRFFNNCSNAQINNYVSNENSNIVNLIKNNKSLKLAFILLCITSFLYLFFGGKRTQRQLPIEKSKASSHVLKSIFISKYYLPQKRIILLKNKLIFQFETFVFNTTQINLEKATEKELNEVASKLNINSSMLKEIIFEKNNNMNTNKKDFIKLHNQLIKILNYGRN